MEKEQDFTLKIPQNSQVKTNFCHFGALLRFWGLMVLPNWTGISEVYLYSCTNTVTLYL